MDYHSQALGNPDRTRLLCWLTWSLLSNRHLVGRWPTLSQRQQALRRWLVAHQRSADWLETARLSWIAAELAYTHRWLLETEKARAAIELLSAIGVVDYEVPVVSALYDRCEAEVMRRRWVAASYAGPAS
jgi:hypothetical protein